jgi:putative DNA primase/helicase
MNAAELAHALKGRRAGRDNWIARCPAHDDRDPSLSISVGDTREVVFKCFAGCTQSDVIAALKDRGLWNGDGRNHHIVTHQRIDRGDDDADRTAAALAIWNASLPAEGTLAEIYLRSRGITLPVPRNLRFHPSLKHKPTETVWPAMVALIADRNGVPMAIHRTYLARDVKAKAEVEPNKMTLGPCKGAAVRLGDIVLGKPLAIAEGIETALSVAQACQLPVWAALSAENLKTVQLPKEATMVTVCADNDANGTGQRAAQALADRLIGEGRRVRVATPENPDTDFNDELLKEAQHVD